MGVGLITCELGILSGLFLSSFRLASGVRSHALISTFGIVYLQNAGPFYFTFKLSALQLHTYYMYFPRQLTCILTGSLSSSGSYPPVLPLGYAVSLHVATITQFCACKHWGAE